MSSASNYLETGVLEHILQNEDIPLIGDAAGLQASATAGSLYVALHAADPGEGGDQETNECSYTDYARVAVARNTSEWDVSGAVGSNLNVVLFAIAGSDETATHFSVGTAATGGGEILWADEITSGPLDVTTGNRPRFPAGSITITVA